MDDGTCSSHFSQAKYGVVEGSLIYQTLRVGEKRYGRGQPEGSPPRIAAANSRASSSAARAGSAPRNARKEQQRPPANYAVMNRENSWQRKKEKEYRIPTSSEVHSVIRGEFVVSAPSASARYGVIPYAPRQTPVPNVAPPFACPSSRPAMFIPHVTVNGEML